MKCWLLPPSNYRITNEIIHGLKGLKTVPLSEVKRDIMDRNELKKLLNSGKTLIMPDAYDAISAKLIEKSGFKAVQCSGFSFSTVAGYKKESEMTLDENLEWTRCIVNAVNIPVMADAEDGYGGPEKVIETVNRFIRVGVSGLNIEDQIPDFNYPLTLVDEELMIKKIKIAREASIAFDFPEFIINGRTDALKSTENRNNGLKTAINRANKYLEAGADLAFIPYVETLDEVKKIKSEVEGPVSIAAGMNYNINQFSIGDLVECGVERVSLPTLLLFSSLQAIQKSLKYLKKDQLLEFVKTDWIYPYSDLNKLWES